MTNTKNYPKRTIKSRKTETENGDTERSREEMENDISDEESAGEEWPITHHGNNVMSTKSVSRKVSVNIATKQIVIRIVMFCDLRPQSSETLLPSTNTNTLQSQSVLLTCVFIFPYKS